MKGNDRILATLNRLLADELTAINQYMVHSEMCANWGYDRLHKVIEKTAVDEMKHAEAIIGRILFLEGTPVVSKLNPIHVGKDVAGLLANDLNGEHEAVANYNAAIIEATELRDGGTRELFEHILKDEERHTDWHEAQRDQIAQMGIENFLVMQTKE